MSYLFCTYTFPIDYNYDYQLNFRQLIINIDPMKIDTKKFLPGTNSQTGVTRLENLKWKTLKIH